MRPTALAFAALLAASHADASSFDLSPAMSWVQRGQHSQEITLSYLPSGNVSSVEAELNISLNSLVWVQVIASPSTPEYRIHCVLVEGMVRVILFQNYGQPLPTQPIPLCRLAVRPRIGAPTGDYRISMANVLALVSGAYPYPTTVDYARLIVN